MHESFNGRSRRLSTAARAILNGGAGLSDTMSDLSMMAGIHISGTAWGARRHRNELLSLAVHALPQNDDDTETETTSKMSNVRNKVTQDLKEGVIDSLAMFRVVCRDALDQYPKDIRSEVETLFQALSPDSKRAIMCQFDGTAFRSLERGINRYTLCDGVPISDEMYEFIFGDGKLRKWVPPSQRIDVKKPAGEETTGSNKAKDKVIDRSMPSVSSADQSPNPGVSRFSEYFPKPPPKSPICEKGWSMFVDGLDAKKLVSAPMEIAPCHAQVSTASDDVISAESLSEAGEIVGIQDEPTCVNVTAVAQDGVADEDIESSEQLSEETMVALRDKWGDRKFQLAQEARLWRPTIPTQPRSGWRLCACMFATTRRGDGHSTAADVAGVPP